MMILPQSNAPYAVLLPPLRGKMYLFLVLPAFLWMNFCAWACGAIIIEGEKLREYNARLAANSGAPEAK